MALRARRDGARTALAARSLTQAFAKERLRDNDGTIIAPGNDMRRHLCLAAAVTIAGFTAFLAAVPGGIRTAEGCSGSSSHWTAPGWKSASWAVDPMGVPTDGAVRLALETQYTNSSNYWDQDAGSGVVITVHGPDDALVPGLPTTVDGPPATTLSSGTTPSGTAIVTWQPDSPFVPSAVYTLHVEGLLDAPVDLQFTAGPGPFQPPKPVMTAPSLTVSHAWTYGRKVCCLAYMTSDCVDRTTCVGETIDPVPHFSAQIDVDEPVAAAKAFLVPELQLSVDGEGFFSAESSSLDVGDGATKTICARVVATNILTSETATSTEWCAPTDGLDLSDLPNCKGMAEVQAKCADMIKTGTPGDPHLSDDALTVYADGCGSAGSSGAGGGSNDAGVDASSAAGAAGTADEAGAQAEPANTQATGGCSTAAHPRPSGVPGAVAAMLFALLAALRSR